MGAVVSNPIFELADVTYTYQMLVALDGFSMYVHAGQRVVLLGANGSGKSTLLQVARRSGWHWHQC